ncbi:MAG: hypothetical protein ACXWCY_34155 [Burkholderiales bacterium]
MWNHTATAFALICAAALSASATAVLAAQHGQQTIANGMEMHYSIVSADSIRAYPDASAERVMHGGPPRGESQRHLMLALFDAKTKQRIEGATVRARVGELAMTGEEKKLEPMTMGGALTYGNYFKLTGHGPYRIVFSISRPNTTGTTEASFDYAP